MLQIYLHAKKVIINLNIILMVLIPLLTCNASVFTHRCISNMIHQTYYCTNIHPTYFCALFLPTLQKCTVRLNSFFYAHQLTMQLLAF